MNKGMGKGAPVTHRVLAAALVCAAVGVLFVTVPNAFGAEVHNHPYPHGSDPSLGQKVGDKGRFSKAVSVTGEIWVVEAYDPKSNYPYLKLLKTGDDRMYGLYGNKASELELGKRYEVSGLLDSSPAKFEASASADILVSNARQLPELRQVKQAPQLSKTGKAGFILAFVSWPGSGPTSFRIDAPDTQNLGNFSSLASNEKFRWDPVESVEIQLPQPLAPCGQSGAPVEAWVDTVRAALEEKGYRLKEDWDALGIAFPENASICAEGAAAYAYISSPQCDWYDEKWCNVSIYGNSFSTLPIIIHELGHTLGLPHANTMLCRDAGLPVTLDYRGGCVNDEYGDRFDNMGAAGFSWNSSFIDRLGWVGRNEKERVAVGEQVDREITLAPYAANRGLRILEAALPPVQASGGLRSPGRLFLEFRTRVGLDSFLYPNSGRPVWTCQRGVDDAVYLRVVPNSFGRELLRLNDPDTPWPNAYILDTSPQTVWDWTDSVGLCDAGLQPGESWQDPTGDLMIDFLRRSADLSNATIRLRSKASQISPPTMVLEKVGEGRGKIVIDEVGIECDDRCTHELEDESRFTARAVPGRGSIFRYWAPDPGNPSGCGQFSASPSCVFSLDWGQRRVLKAYFEPDPNFPRPDVELSAVQLTPANLKIKAGQKARLTVKVTNSGLDEGEAKVSLSSSSPAKAKVPGSVTLRAPGEASVTRPFTVTTSKKQKGKVTITAKLGSQTARASLVLAK